MSFDYSPLQDIAADLIDQFGTSVTHQGRTPGTYVPGQPSSTSMVTQTGRGVLTDYTQEDRPAGLTEVNARRILLSTAGITVAPNVGDRITIGGETYEIRVVTAVRPATTTILYDLAVQR